MWNFFNASKHTIATLPIKGQIYFKARQGRFGSLKVYKNSIRLMKTLKKIYKVLRIR